MASITIKPYRGDTDREPVTFELGDDGNVALIELPNGGKAWLMLDHSGALSVRVWNYRTRMALVPLDAGMVNIELRPPQGGDAA